jgi:serine/threonine-protein kinase
VLRPHARGGLGEVFIALDNELRREVALKEIQHRLADHPGSRARFVLEAEVTGGLEHPGVVPVYSLGAYADGRPFYAMRFIRGETLREAIQRFHDAGSQPRGEPEAGVGRVAFRQLLRRFIDVCNAVGYAHSRGVLHRDLKPGNVMLGPFGETLVVDWGLAKVLGRADEPATPDPTGASREQTQAGAVLGTPAYMSPEQAAGQVEKVGPASDVYSLGAILHALLTGQPPRQGAGVLPALSPGVPRALEAICRKAMALRPEDRYASAQDVAADVERWLADEPVSAYREPFSARVRRWLRRRRTLVAGVAAALVVAALGSSVAALLLSRAYDREHGARTLAQENEARAAQQRDRAERHFKHAREAVDQLLTRVGEELADTPQAERLRRALLEDALAFHQRFLKEEGDDPGVRLQGAQAAQRVGLINWRLDRPRQAEKAYAEALAQLGRLAEDYPQKREYRHELLHTWNYLGTLHYGQGKLTPADDAWKKALDLLDELPADYPDPASHQHTRAGLSNNRANLLRDQGKLKEADAGYRRAIALHAPLARKYPGRHAYRHDLVLHHDNLARVLHQRGRTGEALAVEKEALRLAEGLVKEHPGHAAFRALRADVLFRLGLLAADTAPREAEKSYRATLALSEELVGDFPFTAEYRSSLGIILNNLALALKERKQLREARALLGRAVAAQEQALKISPRSRRFRPQLRKHYANLLSTLLELKEHGPAARAAEALVATLPDDPGALVEAAGTLARCGEADRATALLRQAINAGYRDWEALITEERWVPLRPRADFRKLSTELGESVRKKALAGAERRRRARPKDPDAVAAVTDALNDLGLWYRFLRRQADGVAVYERSLTLCEQNARAHPKRDDLALNLGGTCCNLAHLLSDGEKPERAFARYAQAHKVLEPLLRKDERTRQTAARFLRNVHMGRGELYTRLGKHARAVGDLDRALVYCPKGEEGPVRWARVDALARAGEHVRACAEADDLARGTKAGPGELYNLACVYALAVGAAERGGKPDLAEGYLTRAVRMLRRVQAAGYFADRANVEHLKKDPDLDPIRKRALFREWLRGLGAPCLQGAAA